MRQTLEFIRDCWFNAIVHQWPDDPRTVHVLDPQHIMTTA